MLPQVTVINERRIAIDGFLYVKSREAGGKSYWDCKKVRDKVCKARAITKVIDGVVSVLKGPEQSKHTHPPSREEAEAERIKIRVRSRASERTTPSVILQEELAGASARILTQLPERENLKKALRRERKKNAPANPNSLDELDEIPHNLKVTTTGDRFLMYDSLGTDDLQDGSRVIVFATRRNLELLRSSRMWYLDGTFRVSPSIFTQVFTVLGTYNQNPNDPESPAVAFPYIYCLLSSKETIQYRTALEAIVSAAEESGIRNLQPRELMSDLEVAILNAVEETFPDSRINTCFFHLGQALYRKIQKLGLQTAYNDANNTDVKDFTHLAAALAFVPVGDVARIFRLLKVAAPANMADFMGYFDGTYVSGIPAQGRRRAVAPRDAPQLWNQYMSTLTGHSRTNNASEGWHNRFRLIVGKNHPDVFSLIEDFQKEQGDTEIQVTELSLGTRVKAAPKKAWADAQKKVKEDCGDVRKLWIGSLPGIFGSNCC